MENTRKHNILEQKELTGTFKDVDVKNGIVTGYFAHFGNMDSDRDIIEKGAFSKTIVEQGPAGANRILHLLQHDATKVLGKPYLLKEDNLGLYFESKIAPTTLGKDVLMLYGEGVYNEHSIGFKTIRYEFVDNTSEGANDYHWVLKELRLYEGSTVAWGANDMTPFIGFKCANKDDAFMALDKKLDVITKALRTQGLTDETYLALEIQAAQIKSLYRQIDSLVTTSQPPSAKGTGEENKPNEKEQQLKEAHDKDVQQKQNQNLKTILKYF